MLQRAKQLIQLVTLTLLSTFVSLANAAEQASGGAERWQMNMTESVTAVGAEIYGLHMLILWICVIIGVAVFAVMFYAVYAHRKSQGAVAATWHEHLGAELAWTIIPVFILVAMAFPATKTLISIYDTEEADIDVLITGYQWKWKYEYLNEDGENVSFFSNLKTPQDQIYNRLEKGENYLLEVDEPLVLPVGKKVRFRVTAADVLHSWWVPDLAVKKDAIPGFVNEAWSRPAEIGVYRGQCAELCGKDHGFMPIVVNVTSQEDFDAWMAGRQAQAAELAELMGQQFSLTELVERGESVFASRCVACHGAGGEGGVGAKLIGSSIVAGTQAELMDMVVHGSKKNPLMQAFGAQLNDLDMAATLTYVRNSWGNNMGDSVQAIDVYNFKKGQ